jgi:flagellar hook-associated protein 1 FlgK
MVDILQIGASSLLAFRQAQNTTGHNIANVNTPNFSRQRVELTSNPPELRGGSYIGTGVNVEGVERVYDDFLTQQVRSHTSSHSQSETLNGLIGQVETLIGDSETGLANTLQQFFGAAQDVADAPTSEPVRQTMLSRAESLTAQFQDTDKQLSNLRDHVNQGLTDGVSVINNLAESLANVNKDIVKAQGTPNDLLDRRETLLADLSQYIDVQSVPQKDGSLSVFMGSGQSLVMGDKANQLVVGQSAADPQNVEIRYADQPVGSDLSSRLNGGQVGGYLAFRSDVLDPAQNRLGLMAMGLAETFNAQHSQGMDLDGNLGGAFFQGGEPRVAPHGNNSGTGAPTVAVSDAGQLTGSDYALSYSGSSFEMRRLTDDTVVASGAGPFNVDGLDIDLTGVTPVAGDRFVIRPTQEGATGFALAVNDPRGVAAALPVHSEALEGNQGSGKITVASIADAGDASLRSPVEIQFTGPATFDVVDSTSGTSLATGQPYTSGDPIAFNGWEVSISGVPASGDKFLVTDNNGGVGDNGNMRALADLQTGATLLNGTNSYQGVNDQLVTDVAAQGSRTASTLKSQSALLAQAEKARDAVSGVNLDEEATNLLRYQRAYEASAQLIRVADDMFQTLLGVVRR